MFNKKTLLLLFVVMALVQLYVPARMILEYEMIIRTGAPFKFRIAPVDPLDPVRGKYITLDFKDVTATVNDPRLWEADEKVFVELANDPNGYAMISNVSKSKPSHPNFVSAKVGFTGSTNEKKIFIKFPFDRFYMEETKASGAETIYREAARDPNQVAYALVYVNEGESALTDVFINNVSIQKIVEDYNRKHK